MEPWIVGKGSRNGWLCGAISIRVITAIIGQLAYNNFNLLFTNLQACILFSNVILNDTIIVILLCSQ